LEFSQALEESAEDHEGAQQPSDRLVKEILDRWISHVQEGSSGVSAQEEMICTIRSREKSCQPLDLANERGGYDRVSKAQAQVIGDSQMFP
jgi:hypothetical protein